MIDESLGSSQSRVTRWSPAVAVRPLGATGGAARGVAVTSSDDGPQPAKSRAWISKVYAVPLVSPVTVCDVVEAPEPAMLMNSSKVPPPSMLRR